MTKQEEQAEALERAKSSQATSNYPIIIAGFIAKGIPEADIKLRENVFTFQAWKALGRSVKKGEHGVKIVTFINVRDGKDENGEQKPAHRKPHTTTVFHISQTEPTREWPD